MGLPNSPMHGARFALLVATLLLLNRLVFAMVSISSAAAKFAASMQGY
jgi:hypothetical protein